jgi:hypothetical protein
MSSPKPRSIRPVSPYEKLEMATRTLEKERKFFEALIAADPVATVVNRIIHLVTLFQGAQKYIPPYLERSAARLFPNDSSPSPILAGKRGHSGTPPTHTSSSVGVAWSSACSVALLTAPSIGPRNA